MSISADLPPDGGLIPVTCTLSVTISGLASADAHGERFDLGDRVASSAAALPTHCAEQGFDPASTTITDSGLSLLQYSGPCTVYIQLIESSSNATPMVFGGVTAPR